MIKEVCTWNLLGRTVIQSIIVFGNTAWDVNGAQKNKCVSFYSSLNLKYSRG